MENPDAKDLISMLRTRVRVMLQHAKSGDFKSAKFDAKSMLRWLEKAEGGTYIQYKRRKGN